MGPLDNWGRPPWLQPVWVGPTLFLVFILTSLLTVWVAGKIGGRKTEESPSRREYALIVLIGLLPMLSCGALSYPIVLLGPIWGGVVMGWAIWLARCKRREQIEERESRELLAQWSAQLNVNSDEK